MRLLGTALMVKKRMLENVFLYLYMYPYLYLYPSEAAQCFFSLSAFGPYLVLHIHVQDLIMYDQKLQKFTPTEQIQ